MGKTCIKNDSLGLYRGHEYRNISTGEQTTRAAVALQWHRDGHAVEVTRADHWITIPGATRPERDAERENRAHCKRVALELEAYAAGNVRRCPHCGEIHYRDWDDVGDVFRCPECGDVSDVYEWEQLCVGDYLDDVLDVTWIIDSRRRYHAARFYTTLGGPTVWIDTEHRSVELRWGGESAEYGLDWDTASEVDEWAEEIWNEGC